MPKFEVISIKEALEATKETRLLDEKFGEEYEIDPEPRTCYNCNNPYTITYGESAIYDLCPDCYEKSVKEGKEVD